MLLSSPLLSISISPEKTVALTGDIVSTYDSHMGRKEGKILTPMMRRFAVLIVKTRKKRDSAVGAGYSKKTAHVRATELLKNPLVIAEIERLEAEVRKKAKLTPEDIIEILEALVTFDIADVLDEDGGVLPIRDIPKVTRLALQSLELLEMKNGEVVVAVTKKIRMSDRLKAIDLIGRHHGLFSETLILKDGAELLAAARRGMKRAKEKRG